MMFTWQIQLVIACFVYKDAKEQNMSAPPLVHPGDPPDGWIPARSPVWYYPGSQDAH
jgi:hypothetical protein